MPWQALSRGMGSLVTLFLFYRGERMRFVSEQKETSLSPLWMGQEEGFGGGEAASAMPCLTCAVGQVGAGGHGAARLHLDGCGCPAGCAGTRQLEWGRCDLPLGKHLAP